MKKIILLLTTFLVISCNKDQSNFKITDFTQSKEVIVKPYKYMSYTMFNLKINGYTNDSIIIKTKGVYNLNMKLSGEIDTLWFSDYYGEGPIKFIFEPYKANNGELKIEVKL